MSNMADPLMRNTVIQPVFLHKKHDLINLKETRNGRKIESERNDDVD